MPDAPHLPVQALSARETGQPLCDTLYEGVPPHLLDPLQSWSMNFLDGGLAHRVAATMRIAIPRADFAGPHYSLSAAEGTQLLDIIDVALQLDEALHFEVEVIGVENDPTGFRDEQWPMTSHRARAVERLDQLLRDGGSALQVQYWPLPSRLVRRVDPTVAIAAAHTASAAPSGAARLLRDAWSQVYGLHPNPTTAYRDAVRAVEEIACPLVLPNDGAATLGKVIAHLRQGGHLWAFALVDRDGADTVDPLVGMLDRLWTGQVSRHGGGKKSRDQTTAEAQAAVHIAATLVQLLGANALTQRSTS